MVELAGEMEIFVPAFAGVVPGILAGERRDPLQETRHHRRRAGKLRRTGEKHIACAKRLGEVMGGQADAPLRQIEPQFVAHRPA